MSVTAHNRPIDSEDEVVEIRLSDIITFLKRSRRAMLIGALIGGVIGAFYAFSKPNEYTSQLTVLPELQTKGSSNLGNLSSLAGLAGIDVGGMAAGTDAIRPELYPNVLQSIPFVLSMLKQPVYVQTSKQMQPLEVYLTEKSESGTFSWPSFGNKSEPEPEPLADPTNASGGLRLTKNQETLAKVLQESITGTYEKKSGVLTISSTMRDPVVAATLTRDALNYLTEYVTTYRTEKARREVDFLNKQVVASKQRYQTAEYELSAYRDRNRSVFLNTAKIEEQRLQAEFLLAQELYNTLSKQSEMAKIKVQEETPVFKVLEPARIPLKKSGPKRTMLALGMALVGLILGLAYSFIRRDQ